MTGIALLVRSFGRLNYCSECFPLFVGSLYSAARGVLLAGPVGDFPTGRFYGQSNPIFSPDPCSLLQGAE